MAQFDGAALPSLASSRLSGTRFASRSLSTKFLVEHYRKIIAG
ncbi:MAG: hypothetical protein R3281_15935 [Balneolaceae bacterium]|nr:hypothetical protein [Balneolaceae bacterium]